jgi:RHS repeat-associated protein
MASTGTTVSLRDGFTGKEEQGPDFGVGYIDFGARQYSPTLSRWLVPDPMGEKYYDISPYAYCKDNPLKYIDPDGKSVWSKGLKGFVKVGRSVVKNGVSALNKADTYLDAFSDITEAINTIADSEASVGDKVVAGLSLASELLPVSVEDVKDAGKVVKTIGNKGRPGTIIAKENGITIKTYGTNDAHKPAHAHVTGKGSEVRVGPNGKPLKGQPELSTQQKRVVDNHKKALRKEVKAIGKENKKLEENGKNY